MTDDESTLPLPASRPALPPLRIHHILAATVTAAMLLSLHQVLRERERVPVRPWTVIDAFGRSIRRISCGRRRDYRGRFGAST